METLLHWDRSIFKLINGTWHNSFFDAVLPFLRIAQFWAPLYLFLVVFAIANYRRNGGYWILFFITTVVISNFISSDLIKGSVQRLRPCNDPALADSVRELVSCGSGYSFTSSHAANHFSLAMFSFLTFKKRFNGWPKLFFLWAFTVSYAQMYVGVHYPLDILGGTIVGLITGYITGQIFNNKFGLLRPLIAS